MLLLLPKTGVRLNDKALEVAGAAIASVATKSMFRLRILLVH